MKQSLAPLEGNEAMQALITQQAMQFAEVTLMIARENKLKRQQVLDELKRKDEK